MDHEYFFYIRTINSYGKSAFVEASGILDSLPADKSWAAAQNSLQAKYDLKKGEASATFTNLVNIHYDGVDYDAGMVMGAELKNGKVSTQIGFSARTFIIYNPVNGRKVSMFTLQNGQAFINKDKHSGTINRFYYPVKKL
ncbi:MAG: DUF1983 domain-containing protein [Candidatus Phlomobacter fragariae]